MSLSSEDQDPIAKSARYRRSGYLLGKAIKTAARGQRLSREDRKELSDLNFQLRFFIDDPENGVRNVMSEIYELLVVRFSETGIKIPFPQREIRLLPDSLVDINVTKRSAPWFKWPTKPTEGSSQ